MSKAVKKKGRRLWRTVRKTLGTLFLVSALVIAAIPVDNLQAEGEVSALAVDATTGRDGALYSYKPECTVPSIKDYVDKLSPNKQNPEIYVDETKTLSFVYVDFDGNGNGWHVVVTGCKEGYVTDSTLTIPDTVDAYKRYDPNDGTGGYAAVGRNGNFLFYRAEEDYTNGTIPLDNYNDLTYLQSLISPGNKIIEETIKWSPNFAADDADHTQPISYSVSFKQEMGPYLPCLAEEVGIWGGRDYTRIYYDSKNLTGNAPPNDIGGTEENKKIFIAVSTNQQYQHVKGVKVDYIAKEYFDNTKGTWTLLDESTARYGVFAGQRNFSKIVLGKELMGVGNYAFYNTGITSVTFTNALRTIGEGAFMGCINLAEAYPVTEGDPDTGLNDICANAFRDCRSLKAFEIPWSVGVIGDEAFAGCSSLEKFEMCNVIGNRQTALEKVGFDVFNGCSRLESLTFPQSCATPMYLSTFKGCTALKYICARNPNLTFMDDNLLTYAEFKSTMGNEFYFEGQENSELHKMCSDPKTENKVQSDGTKAACHPVCKDMYFAFSYIDTNFAKRNLYELTMKDEKSDGRNTFVVTNQNELEKYIANGNVENLVIPDRIGPYSITTIRGGADGNGAFTNHCNLKTVVIPNTVKVVEDYAFAGCHNLTSVIFDGFNVDRDIIEIGSNAFKTQEMVGYEGTAHDDGCSGVENDTITDGSGNSTSTTIPKNKLVFIGPISSSFKPFKYAMSKEGAYNNGNQTTSYITYYTGWPYNLKVEYDETKNQSVLMDFPAIDEMATYADNADDPLYRYYQMEKNAVYSAALTGLKDHIGTADITPNENTLLDAALNVKIPDGVEAIDEGLFYRKGEANKKNMTVSVSSSLKEIVADYYTAEDEINDSTKKEGELAPEKSTFAGCKQLTGIELWPGSKGTSTVIGDYAFQDCTKLGSDSSKPVSIDDNSTINKCPFYGCDSLKNVNFGTNPTHYTCKDSIIYAPDANGNFTVLVECLGGRTGYIEPGDIAGVTELRDAAFKGSNVEQVDLTRTSIGKIPAETFADTPDLRILRFPSTLTAIGEKAFKGSGVNYIFASNASNSLVPISIDRTAFEGLIKGIDSTTGKPIDRTDYSEVTWVCEEGTRGESIGEDAGFTIRHATGEALWTVTFWDYSSEWKQDVEVDKVSVKSGEYVLDLPEPRGRDGMVFVSWKIQGNQGNGDVFTNRYPVMSNLDVHATYDVAPPDYGKYTVTFYDDDRTTVINKVSVEPGTNMTTHDTYKWQIPNPTKDGYVFLGWDRDLTNITSDLDVYAQYRILADGECIVRYIADGNVIFSTTVIGGSQAPPITPPTIEGKTFLQWVPEPGIVTRNTDYIAYYRDGSDNNGDNNGDNTGSGNNGGNNGDDNNGGNNGGNTGSDNNTGNNGSNNNNNTGSGNNAGNNGTTTTATFHNLTVQNGSGSGSYIAGAQVIINADAPARGQEFSSWTVSPSDVAVTDKSLASAIISMPDKDVAAIANYKARTSSSSTGSSNTSGTTTNRPNGSTGSGGTTVVIDKNGLSNTGVVSATVNGSSDNFVVKITESSAATEAALKALQAEYGSLDNLKYFPMDISLYDSTGNTKITDTTGLSVTITLPLPDSLITYAGNNMVAGVVNDRLDKLTPRFSTIDGVSCITFTAEHFSPYVIYVDITNLSDGTISDRTPTTGDGIHPKWFLSIGLACLSFVMFAMKDSRSSRNKGHSGKKQKVTVRARN